MKSRILVILLSLTLTMLGNALAAQNWRNICNGTIFFADEKDTVGGFLKDSSAVVNSSDSIWYSYLTFRGDDFYACLDSTYGSVIGNKVIGKANGTFIFFNSSGDSLKLRTNAGLNETWTFLNKSGSPLITATVIRLVMDSVLGFPDSVKTIRLSGFTGGKETEMLISKHYGIVQIPGLYFVPELRSSFRLIGRTAPAAGFQMVNSWQQIYNFSQGDEFHTYRHEEVLWPAYKDVTEKRRVLSVNWAPDSSNVTYTFGRCRHLKYVLRPGQPPGSLDTLISDTIVENISFSSTWVQTRFSKMPFEQDRQAGHQIFSNHYGSRAAYAYVPLRYTRTSECWTYYHGQMPVPEFEKYSPGLGQTWYYRILHDFDIQFSLIYFKKGNENWGTPAGFSCASQGVPESPFSFNFETWPDPCENKLFIKPPEYLFRSKFDLRITDLSGRIVKQIHISGSHPEVDCSGLKPGMYMLLLRDESSGGSACKKFIKQ